MPAPSAVIGSNSIVAPKISNPVSTNPAPLKLEKP